LCNDNTCMSDCAGHEFAKGCIAAAFGGTSGCDVGEGCACKDCDYKQDSCGWGAFCIYNDAEPERSLCNGQCLLGQHYAMMGHATVIAWVRWRMERLYSKE